MNGEILFKDRKIDSEKTYLCILSEENYHYLNKMQLK